MFYNWIYYILIPLGIFLLIKLIGIVGRTALRIIGMKLKVSPDKLKSVLEEVIKEVENDTKIESKTLKRLELVAKIENQIEAGEITTLGQLNRVLKHYKKFPIKDENEK